MSLSKMNIPKILKVGYQNRSGTYTGKLAYVTRIDEKGVHRCENSWNSWRDQKIDHDDFENEPQSGFVINKKVGDYRGGWNGRQAWVRIFDPRGFEFELSVDNLLFILEECSSIKGKGLEGEFVYAWCGKDLVLLPTHSQEYIESSKYTSIQTKKIGKKDMTEGCIYLNKDNDKVMYLGRHDYIEYDYYGHKTNKRHVFKYIDKETYWIQRGFTKLAEKLTEEADISYPDLYVEYIEGKHHKGPVEIKLVPDPYSTEERDDIDTIRTWTRIYKVVDGGDGWFYRIAIRTNRNHSDGKSEHSDLDFYIDIEGRYKVDSKEFGLKFDGGRYNHDTEFLAKFRDWGEYSVKEIEYRWGRNYKQEHLFVSAEKINELEHLFVEHQAINELGNKCYKLKERYL